MWLTYDSHMIHICCHIRLTYVTHVWLTHDSHMLSHKTHICDSRMTHTWLTYVVTYDSHMTHMTHTHIWLTYVTHICDSHLWVKSCDMTYWCMTRHIISSSPLYLFYMWHGPFVYDYMTWRILVCPDSFKCDTKWSHIFDDRFVAYMIMIGSWHIR